MMLCCAIKRWWLRKVVGQVLNVAGKIGGGGLNIVIKFS